MTRIFGVNGNDSISGESFVWMIMIQNDTIQMILRELIRINFLGVKADLQFSDSCLVYVKVSSFLMMMIIKVIMKKNNSNNSKNNND